MSYVVLSFNSARYIERCVRSLASARAGVPGAPAEIWVVDNGSVDESPRILQALESEYPNLRVVRLSQNLGTTVSRNIALRQVSMPYVAVVDSDVEVPAGVVDGLLRTLEQNPECGIVVPRLVYPDGRLQLSTDVFPTIGRKLHRFLALRRIERRARAEPVPTALVPVDYAISAFWLFRRTLLDRVGLLDERIFYAPEDVDYCVRVWAAGLSVDYDPSVTAVHHAQEISRGLPVRRAAWRHVFGLAYLFAKHRFVFSRRRLYRRLRRTGY